MSAGTSALFSLIICFLVCSSDGQEKISAELGQDVILPCKDPNINISNIAVNWSRPGLDPEYVLFYRDGHIDPNQHESYQNRTDLQDKEMKDGDISMILKNVKMEDTATYRCWVLEKRNKYPINIVNLEVYLPGDKGGFIGDGGNMNAGDKTGIIVGPVVGVILLLAVASVGFLIYRRRRRQNQHRPVPPVDPPATEMEIVHKSPAEPATASETLMDSPAEEPTEM